MTYPLEPYKIKVLDSINITSKTDRLKELKKAYYNPFRIPAEKVTIDFLTDSGTSSLSQEQMAHMMLGDESYASSKSWYKLNKAIQEFTGKKEVIPVHQGRAAEKIMAEILTKNGDIAFSNGFFDTTRANFEYRGVTCIDIPTVKAKNLSKPISFKGDIDIPELKRLVSKYGEKAKIVMLTLTNNTGGGQPASLKNVRLARDIAHKNNILFMIDSCRIAENAYFIWSQEHKKKGSIKKIIRDLYSLSDVAHMSAKKDALANSGGFIVTNNKKLAAKFRELGVLYEGFVTYGGMTGRDMETIAQGLHEVLEPVYLDYRIKQTAYLHDKLIEIGIPMISPPGGHAVYIDAGRFFKHIPKDQFPAQALVNALYLEGGVRSVEIGSLMLDKAAKNELVRLAIPRRTYTQSHFDYVINTFKQIAKNKKQCRGYKIAWQASTLRHFTCKLKPV